MRPIDAVFGVAIGLLIAVGLIGLILTYWPAAAFVGAALLAGIWHQLIDDVEG